MKGKISVFCLLTAALLLAGCAAIKIENIGEIQPATQTEVTVGELLMPTVPPETVKTPEPTPEPTPEVTLTPEPDYLPTDSPKEDGIYELVVYVGTQSVVAFHAENGEWVPCRTMICSTGKRTPTGTYSLHAKKRYHSLFGAKGQYVSRIVDNILFHSVPIDEKAKDLETGQRRMKLEEYEKLGTPASDGCVRLPCVDAQWIYDTCDQNTKVFITDENGPVPTKPPELISGEPYETETGYGWDPTDTSPDNPYLKNE